MRVVENLNLALHDVMADRPDLHLLGEDVVDPYGGAFRVTRGLSTRFPDRVLPTPVSEAGIVGVAAGLALAGAGVVVEMMFADFAALAFDQLVNCASKSVSMYGRRLPMPLLVRCPTGGGRGYGPTHSQSLQKHFIGVPDLWLFETSPFHDNRTLLPAILDRAAPALLFEDKVLYTRQMLAGGVVDELFSYDFVAGVARVFVDDPETFDCVLIAPGGVAHRALQAARSLLCDEDLVCLVLVPSRLYPFDVEPLLPALERAGAICVAEESTAGGTWGSEVAQLVHGRLRGRLRRPVSLVDSGDGVVPAAPHLEALALLQGSDIHRAVVEALRD